MSTEPSAWSIAEDWYKPDDIQNTLAWNMQRAPLEPSVRERLPPKDHASREFAEWMTHEYRLAMAKGIELERQRVNSLAAQDGVAEKIADRILWINGINKPGTGFQPLIDGEPAGAYSRRELIEEIQSALNQQPQHVVAEGWAFETMKAINELTPGIQGKAFDPGWFMLRQRLEQAEEAITGKSQRELQQEKLTITMKFLRSLGYEYSIEWRRWQSTSSVIELWDLENGSWQTCVSDSLDNAVKLAEITIRGQLVRLMSAADGIEPKESECQTANQQ